ncbi:cytochrome P450 [Cerioporus squamosus]|nr:cytochrome P450 [Cerioporus squamosus]
MEDPQTVLYAVLAVLAAVYFFRWRSDPLSHIPTVGGPSAPVLSYVSTINFLRKPKALLLEGYQRFHGSVFKVALLGQWVVVVSGPKMVDELRKRPDEEVSFIEGVEETLHTRFTLGREPLDDPFHVEIIKDKLMRSITAVLPDVIDELRAAVPDYIHAKDNEWTTVNTMQTTLKIVSRASNRVFVGLPACRNQEYLELAIRFTIDVLKDTALKLSLGQYFSAVKKTIRQTYLISSHYLTTKSEIEEYGEDFPEKPLNDMLQWDPRKADPPRNYSDVQIVEGGSCSFMMLTYNVTTEHHARTPRPPPAYPDYIKHLREEIEASCRSRGWTKSTMGKMWKVTSPQGSLKRANGIGLVRLQPFHLSSTRLTALSVRHTDDGRFIPKDTLIVAATYPTHYDDSIYENAATFDPFRFSRMREEDGEGTKHQFVNTSNRCFGLNIFPDPSAEIMFRKRQA